ncbi:hypothetical protein HMPREF0239_01951, partial [Clostridium sp. ATCC BAA-442]
MSLPPFFGEILNYIISRPAAQSWTAGTSPLSCRSTIHIGQ